MTSVPNLEALRRSLPRRDEYSLSPYETFWRDHYHWLFEHGYALRHRYHPDWSPSWKGTSRKRWDSEDGVVPVHTTVIDATRISDGELVILKRVDSEKFTDEVRLTQLFSSESWVNHPDNHCVPLHEVLRPPPGDKQVEIMVLPYLFDFLQPPFVTVGEAVEFFRQVFQGLKFIHECGIAHCDVKWNNILMDAKQLYITDFHPMSPTYRRNMKGFSRTRGRTKHPVRYYFIDFDVAEYFAPGATRLVSPGFGGDQSVPEFRDTTRFCDPFAVDVYCMGNTIKANLTVGTNIRKAKTGLDFMEKLLNDMTQDEPAYRPSMEEVVDRFQDITSQLSGWKLRSRLADIDEPVFAGFVLSLLHWIRQILYIVQGIPAIPKQR